MLEDSMGINPTEQIEIRGLLKEIHLFQGLDDVEITNLARELPLISLKRGERLFSQGDEGDSFFIIFSGSVQITQRQKREEVLLATLISGDYFGEEALLKNQRRSASVVANAPTKLLRMDKETFELLLQTHPFIETRLEAVIRSRQLYRKHRFPWLGKDEVVYLLARKHVALLYTALTAPIILAIFSLPFFGLSILAGVVTPNLMGIGVLLLAVGWGIWRIVDWGNDYYIVTNQRVIWLEKVIGVYDSRQEAPLSTILSVSIETDQTGRVFNYGDVIVRTYTGRIIMRNVGHPETIRELVEEYWQRTKKIRRRSEEEAMVSAIRERLGLPVNESHVSRRPEVDKRPTARRSTLHLILASLFYTRYVDGSVITYRKHWFLLFRRVWMHSLSLLALLALLLARVFGYFQIISLRSTSVVVIALFTVIGGIWVYEFADWRNDKYQVTADHIVDIDRRPFGKEERKSAPLENILSLEHERKNLAGILFNFGNVSATVGGSKFTFEGVHDPAQVQQDIFRKMDARKKKKREAEAARERERMSSWLAAYHRNAEEFYQENQTFPFGPESE